MRAVRREERGVVVDESRPAPEAGAGEAAVRPVWVGVSRADRAVAAGEIAFRGVMGHEFSGVVEAVNAPGRADASRWVGKRVTASMHVVCGKCERCRGGLSAHCATRSVLGVLGRDGVFAERCVLPIANLAELPKNVNDEGGVFAQAAAAAVRAAQMIRIEGKTYVTVLGDGVMGLLCAQVMARMNASVRVLGTHTEKLTLCERWGIKHRHVAEAGRRQDQDAVVDCTGEPEGLATAMRMVRPRGKIVLMTAPAPVPGATLAPTPGVDLSWAVVNELEILGCRDGAIAEGVGVLARGDVDVLPLITRRMKLAEAPAALRAAGEATSVRVLMEV